MQRFPRKTTFTIGTFLLFSGALHYAPLIASLFQPPPPLDPPPPPPTAEVLLKSKYFKMPIGKLPMLLNLNGALDNFYSALARTEVRQPGAVTRILHYGDSPTTADLITADVRAHLQRRFGDAGHGFVLLARPWAWYGHRGIGLRYGGWNIEAASTSRAADKLHGLGGVSFTGSAGAHSRITLPDSAHSTVEVYFQRRPGGGAFRLEVGEFVVAEVETDHETSESGYFSTPLPDGAQEVRLTVARGTVRVFGVSFEKREPGVVYSSLGLNGASVQMALYHFDPAQWSEQLRHANPDLVVINYGSNESHFGAYLNTHYPDELRRLLNRVRHAVPRASVLVMSPMDRGELTELGSIVTPPPLPRVIDIQRRAAIDAGCAFFNTFEAMGGPGTMARWYNGNPRMVAADFLHPTPQGASKVGALVSHALIEGFEHWKADRQ